MDFSIIKYYLESYDSGKYRYTEMKKGIPDVLLTKVDIMVPGIMLSVSNNLENNHWVYLSHGSQLEQSFGIRGEP